MLAKYPTHTDEIVASKKGTPNPEAANAILEDSILAKSWVDANGELQKLYSALGPPPLRVLQES